jgi:hypothetical protein
MMKTKYIEFDLVLGNGEKCNVSYCDGWGASLFGNGQYILNSGIVYQYPALNTEANLGLLGKTKKLTQKNQRNRLLSK